MINVVGYARYSSDNQREESIVAQERAIREFCQKNNYNLIKVYKDEAISGTSIKDRTEFLQLIEDSKKKEFQCVVVHKFDRFARNRYDHTIYEKKLNDNGVKLLSVLEQLNDSPESVILKSVLTGMNEYYSLNLSREVKKGLNENALNCIHNGGIPPLGYNLDEDRKYVINEIEAETVRIIYKLYIEGIGYASIAEQLNQMGRLNKLGKPFRKTSIRDILLNEKYTGVFVYGKKDGHGKLTGNEVKIEGGIPQIISKEDFEKIIKSGGVSVIHPDILTCGGILELKKIGDIAAENGVALAIHMAESPVACMAAVHAAAAVQFILALEYHSVRVAWWQDMVNGLPKPLIQDGFIRVPDAPGLGIESLNDAVLKEHINSDIPGIWEDTSCWNKEFSNDRIWS